MSNSLRARVRGGRLVLDEPSSLPEGTEVELIPADDIDELERMLAAVALMPALGAPARSERAIGVRRVLLRKTRHHVYYRVRDETIEVLAVWHAARGSEPGM